MIEPISRIDSKEGILYYRGISVSELLDNSSFESVLFLLIHGRQPDEQEVTHIATQLIDARNHFNENLDVLLEDRMKYGLSLLVLLVDSLDSIQGKQSQGMYSTLLTLVACTPLAIAYDYHLDLGNKPIPSDPNLGHSSNLLWMLTGEKPKAADAVDFEACLILHMDDPDNPSLAALTDSLKSSMSVTAAISSALSAHAGPLHHGAGSEAALMLDELWMSDGLPEMIANRLDHGKILFGLGHRIYKTYDPRARVLREMLQRRHRLGEEYVAFIDEVIAEGSRQLKERKLITVYPNVDLFNAVTYGTFGISPTLNTELFAVARSAGWMAHALTRSQY